MAPNPKRNSDFKDLDERVSVRLSRIVEDVKRFGLPMHVYETKRSEEDHDQALAMGLERVIDSPITTGRGFRFVMWDNESTCWSTDKKHVWLYNMLGSLLVGKHRCRWGKFLKIDGKPYRDYTLFWFEEEDL